MVARTIHPFPARMAPDIAIGHIATASESARMVLDPMCGSGTVLSAATTHGLLAQGFDVDPLAVLMSTVGTQEVNIGQVLEEAESVLHRSESSRNDTPRWADQETLEFAQYWFGNTQRVQLNRLSQALDQVDDRSVQRALQVALSRIIVTKAPRASLAGDTSHSRPHRVITESTYNVYEGFRRSVSELVAILEKRTIAGTATVASGDARSLKVHDQSVDLVITSPPYLNAIDYLRGHKMSLIWLGYTIPQLRRIRSDSIGAERALDEQGSAQVEAMVEFVKKTVDNPDRLPISTITRYARDLTLFADELHRVCRSDAKVVTVIGNSTLRGNYIQNDMLVQTAYEVAGFHMETRTERELPENRRYLPVRTKDKASSIAKRMRAEVVLTARRK